MLLKDSDGNKLTSAHVYHDGQVTFSKTKYNTAE